MAGIHRVKVDQRKINERVYVSRQSRSMCICFSISRYGVSSAVFAFVRRYLKYFWHRGNSSMPSAISNNFCPSWPERKRERTWIFNAVMAVVINSFDSWLTKKLQALNTDESVFGSYIKGILEGDESEDEKSEALEGILAGITEDNIDSHVTEILAAWVKWLPTEDLAGSACATEDVDVRLAKMLESRSLPTTTQRSYTDDEKRVRAAILAQYSETANQEGSEEEGEEEVADGDCGLEKNMNAATIVQQKKEERQRAKLESQKKKEKDKEDREKQKQLKEEKKEKRKTVKGERRR